MDNPFDILLDRLASIEAKLLEGIVPGYVQPEILGSEEICRRLGISEPTLISWRRSKKIPFIQIDGIIRYNWPKVIEALEAGTKKKK